MNFANVFVGYLTVIFLGFSTFAVWAFWTAPKGKAQVNALAPMAKFTYWYGFFIFATSIAGAFFFALYHLGAFILSSLPAS